jgi:hypothetical protein
MTIPAAAPSPAGWGTARRLGAATNVSIQVTLLLIILIGLNWISSRRYRRWDWSDQSVFTLSKNSLSVIEAIAGGEDQCRVVLMYQRDDYGAWDAALGRTIDLLEEYKTRSRGKLTYEVVYLSQVGQAGVNAARKKHDLKAAEIRINDVFFKVGDRERVVNLQEFFEQDWSTAGRNEPPRLTAYRGEDIVTSTLKALSMKEKVVLGFVQGHGETAAEAPDAEGLSFFAIEILEKREGYTLQPVMLNAPGGIPDDVDMLVIASPKKDYAPSEVALLRTHLERGGRILVFLDASSERPPAASLVDLYAFFAEYGIVAGLDVVMDTDYAIRLMESGDNGNQQVVAHKDVFRASWFEKQHPLTKDFDSEVNLHFVRACTVIADPAKAPPGTKTMELVKSSGNSWAEMNFPDDKPTPSVDPPGPLSVAVSASGTGRGGPREYRLVVVGDLTHLNNAVLRMGVGNPGLALNAIRWMTGQDHLIGTERKRVEDRRLIMTPHAESYVFRIAVVAIPLIALGFGGTMWMTRRSQ